MKTTTTNRYLQQQPGQHQETKPVSLSKDGNQRREAFSFSHCRTVPNVLGFNKATIPKQSSLFFVLLVVNRFCTRVRMCIRMVVCTAHVLLHPLRSPPTRHDHSGVDASTKDRCGERRQCALIGVVMSSRLGSQPTRHVIAVGVANELCGMEFGATDKQKKKEFLSCPRALDLSAMSVWVDRYII